jgi:hypothetical protein
MSTESQKRRAEKRAAQRESDAIVDVVLRHDDEPTAKLWSLWAEPGQGYVWCEVELPRSIVEQYAVKTSVPDVLPIALAKMEAAIEDHAGKGVL